MKVHAVRRSELKKVVMLAVLAFWAMGCASPPSVMPLLAVTQAALEAEALRLEADALRDAQWATQTKQTLARAFEDDLAERDALTAEWVSDATDVYVAAREAVVRHELAVQAERAQRADNLRAAAQATQRAQAMLQQQDALVTGLVGTDMWTLMRSGASSLTEGAR